MINKCILGAAGNMLFNEYVSAKGHMVALRIDHWIKYEFLSSQWFALIVTTILIISIWWWLLDKKRLVELLLFGFFVAATSSIMDGVGTEFNAWEYSVKILPTVFPLLMVDLSILPLVLMLLYQYFEEWKHFIMAMVIASAIFSFIVEPIFHYAGIYQIFTWTYYYSFPLYILIAAFYKWLMQVIIDRQMRERSLQ